MPGEMTATRKLRNPSLAAQAKRKAEYAARDEDTPERIQWFKNGIRRRRAEFGWVNESEEDVDERQERSRI